MKYWLSGLVLILSTSCGEDFESVVEVPDAPTTGIQLHFKQITVMPGEDKEFCTYFNLETAEQLEALGAKAFDQEGNLIDDPFLLQNMIVNNVDIASPEIAVERVEIIASEGLHHVQLMTLQNDTFDYDERHIFECGIDLFGGPLTGDVEPLFFTSLPDYDVGYEPGTARILKRAVDMDDETVTRGTQLLYNFHYLNTSDAPIEAEVVVNLYTVDRETVVHPIRSAWWNFVYFNAESGVQSIADGKGSFKVDVEVVGITSHQHEVGSMFTYSRDDEEIYRSTSWSEPEYISYMGGTPFAADEELKFHCEWNNAFPEDRFFGLQADDEMCTAIVEYHPVDEEAAEALLDELRKEAEMQGEEEGFLGGVSVSLENFIPFPDEVVEEIENNPDGFADILDGEIMCGIAKNFQEMEEQYGRAPDTLAELQRLIDILIAFCGLDEEPA
jgi:hypothetical protein